MTKKLLSIISLSLLLALPAFAANLVLLHSNDTHSLIYPDEEGRGGVLQRKAIIDSIRAAEPNVILVDAGDVVQGTLFFKFFRGEVEYPLMDMMGYDIRILGNHEFDNGIDDIAKYYRHTSGTPLSANYDFTGTSLDGIFSPYTVREIDGKKIGFFGINIDPASLIDKSNTGGLVYSDAVEVANRTAQFLKKKLKCNLVVAVTHIGVSKKNGKATDYDLAAASKYIDIIIGGHSHTVIQPGNRGDYPSIVMNADGRPVLVAQTGKSGKYLGYINVDLDNLGDSSKYDYRLIPVTDRFPAESYDAEIIEFLRPYTARVDSVNRHVIARSAGFYGNDDHTWGLPNLTADMAYEIGRAKADSLRLADPSFPEIDFAFMNIGGIRKPMREGDITEGQILDTYPFSNHLALATVKGSDLAEALAVAASKGGESVSNQLRVIMDAEGNVSEILVNGLPLDPDKSYTYATIDYVLGGNDDLVSLANSIPLWRDEVEVCAPILDYISRMGKAGLPIEADTRPRFVVKSPL